MTLRYCVFLSCLVAALARLRALHFGDGATLNTEMQARIHGDTHASKATHTHTHTHTHTLKLQSPDAHTHTILLWHTVMHTHTHTYNPQTNSPTHKHTHTHLVVQESTHTRARTHLEGDGGVVGDAGWCPGRRRVLVIVEVGAFVLLTRHLQVHEGHEFTHMRGSVHMCRQSALLVEARCVQARNCSTYRCDIQSYE